MRLRTASNDVTAKSASSATSTADAANEANIVAGRPESPPATCER